MKKTVIVVGAGAAGLIAARKLSEKKYSVIILEAGKESGGRIQTHAPAGNEGVVEGGAEFIHGRLPLTLALCNEGNIKYIPAEGKMYRRINNKWKEETEMTEGWEKLIKKMGSLKEDMTLNTFLEEYYGGDNYTELKKHVLSFVEGFDLADPEKVSVRSLYEEWSKEQEENFRIPGGYNKLIHFIENECLKSGCVMIKEDAVTQIVWQKGEVTAYTASGKKYSGEKILVTVPVSLLTGVAGIEFIPAMEDRSKAAADIGFGPVIKVALHFTKRFWKKDTRFIFSEEMIPTWWTQLPLKNNLLTGWAGGPKASKMNRHSDEELLEIALVSLSNIFSLGTASLRSNLDQWYVFNWKEGAYSYATPQSKAAKKLLNTPLENTVFFAGEGLYEGDYPGTVEAALASGKQTAGLMM